MSADRCRHGNALDFGAGYNCYKCDLDNAMDDIASKETEIASLKHTIKVMSRDGCTETRWKRYLFAVLTAVAYNKGTLFANDWKLTDTERDDILAAYRKRVHETST